MCSTCFVAHSRKEFHWCAPTWKLKVLSSEEITETFWDGLGFCYDVFCVVMFQSTQPLFFRSRPPKRSHALQSLITSRSQFWSFKYLVFVLIHSLNMQPSKVVDFNGAQTLQAAQRKILTYLIFGPFTEGKGSVTFFRVSEAWGDSFLKINCTLATGRASEIASEIIWGPISTPATLSTPSLRRKFRREFLKFFKNGQAHPRRHIKFYMFAGFRIHILNPFIKSSQFLF